MEQDEVAQVVARAAAGDGRAWEQLVSAYGPLLTAVGRGYRLDEATVQDAVQTAWLRLYEHIGTLHRPEHVAGWLVTTVRRECLAVLRRGQREVVRSGEEHEDEWGLIEAAEDEVVRNDESRLVRQAIRQLPDRQRVLMSVLVFAPDLDYRQVSGALSIPVGSIGPTRGRALCRLRDLLREPAAVAA